MMMHTGCVPQPSVVNKILLKYMIAGRLVMLRWMQKKQLLIYYIRSSSQRIYLLFPEVLQQKDGASCGVYALAYAHTLAEGKDPSSFFEIFPMKLGYEATYFSVLWLSK